MAGRETYRVPIDGALHIISGREYWKWLENMAGYVLGRSARGSVTPSMRAVQAGFGGRLLGPAHLPTYC